MPKFSTFTYTICRNMSFSFRLNKFRKHRLVDFAWCNPSSILNQYFWHEQTTTKIYMYVCISTIQRPIDQSVFLFFIFISHLIWEHNKNVRLVTISYCLRFTFLLPIFSAWMSMPFDVPNVETRTSNLLSKLMACAIRRAPSMVDSLNLFTHNHGMGLMWIGDDDDRCKWNEIWK